MHLQYVDHGEIVELVTDNTFKTHPSAILADDYRFGETYDANAEIENWTQKNFDDSSWDDALLTNAPEGEITLCRAQPLVVETELKPVNIFKEDDSYIYDFGVSNAGVCRLNINGCKGQKIELQHADLLKDGKFHLDNIWFVRDYWERDKDIVHKDTFICKGGAETYIPTFTYHGFRYVKVTGITEEQATKDLLTFVVFHSDLASKGNFSCSCEVANTLQEMTRRSDLSNFHYFPTDCPQREKNGWTGDAALSCEQLLLNFNPEASYREWLRNIRKAQAENGALPGIVPTTGWGFSWGNGPAWDRVLFYIPYYTYVYRGETTMIADSAEAFLSYLRYLETRKDDKGLIHIGLGDWCHVGRTEPKAPLIVTDSIISMDIANKAAFMFDVIGKTEYKHFAIDFTQSMRTAIRKNLIDFDTMTALGSCQSSQSMCLYYKLFEPEEETEAVAVLRRLVKDADDHMDVGILGGEVLFFVLSDFGYADLAFTMITRPDYPSYGNWIERGATTLWENFHPDFVDSPNHHFWGVISAWFIKRLAGIVYNPSGLDGKAVAFCPQFIAALQHAQAHYDSPYGTIRCSWKRDGSNVMVEILVPETVEGTLHLPQGYCFTDGSSSKSVKTDTYRVVPSA